MDKQRTVPSGSNLTECFLARPEWKISGLPAQDDLGFPLGTWYSDSCEYQAPAVTHRSSPPDTGRGIQYRSLEFEIHRPNQTSRVE
jgi:hypothetical protein